MAIPLGPIQVNSSLFLQVFVGAQRCDCGGFFRRREQRRVRRNGTVIRQVLTICRDCRRPRMFEFDVSSLDESDENGNQFVRTLGNFLDGMNALKQTDYRGAKDKFLKALHEENGEPNFTIAHYYLGRIAIETGRTQEAIRRFQRAALLQPMEIAFHEALCEAHQASGNLDAALAELALAEDLKLKIGSDPMREPTFEE